MLGDARQHALLAVQAFHARRRHLDAAYRPLAGRNRIEERDGKFEPQPGHLVDIMPTVVELTGAKYPNEYHGHAIQPEEGVSLVPAIAGKPIDRTQPIFFAHEGNRALRSGKWKLVMKYKGPWELYDMEADRTERHNLADQKPELAKQLVDEWDAWAKRADVDPWTGPARNDWGAEIGPKKKQPAGKPKKKVAASVDKT